MEITVIEIGFYEWRDLQNYEMIDYEFLKAISRHPIDRGPEV